MEHDGLAPSCVRIDPSRRHGTGIDDGAERPSGGAAGTRLTAADHLDGALMRGRDQPVLDRAFVGLVQAPVPQEEERLLHDVLRL